MRKTDIIVWGMMEEFFNRLRGSQFPFIEKMSKIKLKSFP